MSKSNASKYVPNMKLHMIITPLKSRIINFHFRYDSFTMRTLVIIYNKNNHIKYEKFEYDIIIIQYYFYFFLTNYNFYLSSVLQKSYNNNTR